MSTDPVAVIDALEQQLSALRGLSQNIAEEIARGRACDMVQIGRWRPKVAHQLHALSRTLTQYARLPASARPSDFLATINQYRAEAGIWANIDRKLRIHLPPQPCPLEDPLEHSETRASVQQGASDQLLSVLHAALKADQQTEDAHALGCHDDIPLRSSWFFDAVHAAYRVLLAQDRAKGAAFLDIGCGNGMKVIAAQPFFEYCDGLEYQDTSVQVANDLIARTKLTGCEVFEGNGLTFDRYGDYQVIYLFRPMREPAQLMALEDRVLAQVAPGTVIIAPYQAFNDRSAEVGCGKITQDVFVAGLDQPGADALREEAEHTGLGLRQRKLLTPSVWDPIIHAAERRGIALSPFRAER